MKHRPTVGLAGCGRWGRNILRDLLALGCRVHVADPAAEARKHAADTGAETCETIEQLPRSLDGYVIATPTALHAECIRSLLDRGAPIFCEKPLSIDEDEIRNLVAAGGDRLFVMHKWRYHPGVIKLGELARSGILGRLTETRCVRKQWAQPHLDVDGVWILAPHDLSILIEIHGHLPQPEWAQGGGAGTTMNWLTAGLGRGETRSTLDVSCVWPRNERMVCLVGEEAIAFLPSATTDHVAISRISGGRERTRSITGGEVEKIAVSTEYPLYRELEIFVSHLTGGPRPPSSALEGLEVIARLTRLRAMAGFAPAPA